MFRSVDPACNPGIPHRVAMPPLSEGPASLPPFLSGRDGVSGIRNKSDAIKASNLISQVGAHSQRRVGVKNDRGHRLPTFWIVMCSLGLYQDNEGSSHDPERNGHHAHHLHRQHPGHGGVRDSIEGTYNRDHLPPGELEFVTNLPKSLLEPTKTIDFLLDYHHGAETPRRQGKEPLGRGKEDSDSRPHNSPGLIQPAGKNEFYYKGGSDGSPQL